MDLREQTFRLIDDLKLTCQSYGLGNDGNEYKIITQMFLYKFLNDKFGYAIKHACTDLSMIIAHADNWETAYAGLQPEEREELLYSLDPNVPKLQPEHLVTYLWNNQTKGEFDALFDSTMEAIAHDNIDIFSTQSSDKERIPIFEPLTIHVTDVAKRADFASALIDKLVNFSFEATFSEHYDFFATIFEHLIKDYNTDSGGKYAEYYTPHSIATIMARLLVGDNPDLRGMEVYDPSAGTGTLLMALAHQIGEERCTIYSQDISQRSNKMLKLNLILNNLVHSLDNAIQGDTLTEPFHKNDAGTALRQFDFIVSNPPFKVDFPGTHAKVAAQTARFWAGVPNVPPKIDPKKPKMAIYTCFLQHVINSLKPGGKAAIVVPTGFITAKSGIEGRILKHIVENQIVYGCISMPSNVFATTGTNVSVVFLQKPKQGEDFSQRKVTLIDASKLGEEYKEGNNQKRRLLPTEIDQIVNTFANQEAVEGFSVAVSYDELKEKGCSLSAGQYFDIKIEYEDITADEFASRINNYKQMISEQFAESRRLEDEILKQLQSLNLK
jgi:type I restriction enzyme M protein